MEKNDKTGKQSYDELENSAQGLLRRLNNRYDATRVEAEKSAMKNLDAMEDSDAGDPDVVAYTATAEVPAVKEKKKKRILRRIPERSARRSCKAFLINISAEKTSPRKARDMTASTREFWMPNSAPAWILCRKPMWRKTSMRRKNT